MIKRFLSKIFFQGNNDCWIWEASKNNKGYGTFAEKGRKTVMAHRLSYELFRGPIVNGLTVDHLCKNRACVNPKHLELVSHLENLMRGSTVNSSRHTKTHCPKGHPYTKKNTYITRAGYWQCRTCNIERKKS